MKDLQKYNKFWVALTAAAGVLVLALSPSDLEPAFHVNSTEWYQVLVAFAGSIGVYQVTNHKEKK